MRRYALRDDQWERIRDLLPGREGYVGGQLRITAYLSMLSCIDLELWDTLAGLTRAIWGLEGNSYAP